MGHAFPSSLLVGMWRVVSWEAIRLFRCPQNMQMGSQAHVSEAGMGQLGLSSVDTISWMLAASDRQCKSVAAHGNAWESQTGF